MPILTDGQHSALLARMRSLPPVRNITAIHAWLSATRADLVAVYEALTRGAGNGHQQAKTVVMLMMAAFAAGRAYQEANPDAPRDPNGY
jgi:hypothetical protein